MGRVVRTLENGRFEPGFYETRWDGRSENGLPAASGVYVVHIQTGEFLCQKKMALLR